MWGGAEWLTDAESSRSPSHSWCLAPHSKFLYMAKASKNEIVTAGDKTLVLVKNSEPGVGEVAVDRR